MKMLTLKWKAVACTLLYMALINVSCAEVYDVSDRYGNNKAAINSNKSRVYNVSKVNKSQEKAQEAIVPSYGKKENNFYRKSNIAKLPSAAKEHKGYKIISTKKEKTLNASVPKSGSYTIVSFHESFKNSEKSYVKVFEESKSINAHEFVVTDQFGKISELIWDTKNAKMIGVKVHANLSEKHDIGVSITAATTISENQSYMEDYDWRMIDRTLPWSDRSQHKNTTLKNSYYVDLNISKGLLELENGFKLNAGLGLSYEHYKWASIGGSYIYTSNVFRDTTGNFGNVPVISYEINRLNPYVKLDAFYKTDKLLLNAGIKGSSMASVNSIDNHILRSLTIQGKTKSTKTIGYNLNLEYNMYDNLWVNGGYDYSKTFYKRGMSSYDGAPYTNFNAFSMTESSYKLGMAYKY